MMAASVHVRVALQLQADNERLRAAATGGGRGLKGLHVDPPGSSGTPGAAVEATGAALHRQVRRVFDERLSHTAGMHTHTELVLLVVSERCCCCITGSRLDVAAHTHASNLAGYVVERYKFDLTAVLPVRLSAGQGVCGRHTAGPAAADQGVGGAGSHGRGAAGTPAGAKLTRLPHRPGVLCVDRLLRCHAAAVLLLLWHGLCV